MIVNNSQILRFLTGVRNDNPQKLPKGFTLIEMMIAMVVALVAFLAIGGVLVDSQKGWNKTYQDINEGPDAESYLVRLKFDSIVRRSVDELIKVSTDGKELYTYWYSTTSVPVPDKYGRFYLSGTDLILQTNSGTEIICKNVNSLIFHLEETKERTVKMILEIRDKNNSEKTNIVICGAMPQNFLFGRI